MSKGHSLQDPFLNIAPLALLRVVFQLREGRLFHRSPTMT